MGPRRIAILRSVMRATSLVIAVLVHNASADRLSAGRLEVTVIALRCTSGMFGKYSSIVGRASYFRIGRGYQMRHYT